MIRPIDDLMRLVALIIILAGAFIASKAKAVPLDPLSTFCTANPTECRKGSVSLLTARGIGTNEYYVVEINPTTGELPVDAAFTFSGNLNEDHNYGAVGADTLRTAAQVGNATGAADFGAGSPGAQTLRTAAMLGVGSAVVSNANPVPVSDAGGALTVDGTVSASNLPATVSTNTGAADASTLRSILSSDSTVSAENFPTTVDTDFGTPGASTPRAASMLGVGTTAVSNSNPVPVILGDGTNVVASLHNVGNSQATVNTPGRMIDAFTITAGWDGATHREMSMNTDGDVNIADGGNSITVDGTVAVSSTTNPTGRSYADSVRNNYASTNVTTAAWVEVIASTAATINELLIDDTCGEVLELGTGAAAAETRKLLIPRGGMTQAINLAIPSGTRISLKAVSGNCTSGDFVLTGLN